MFSRDGRDKRGLSPKSKPVRGSYAEQRINELKKERAKYNVNDLGFYNGGVPRAHRGNIRGSALDSPGGWHIIGISPLDFFDLKSKNPCFAKPGDKIQFIEISSKKYQQMKKENSVKPIYK